LNASAGTTDVIVANADGSGSRVLGVQVGQIRPTWYPKAAAPRPEPSAGAPATRTGSLTPSGCAPLDRAAQNSVAVDLGSGAVAGPAHAGAPANGVVAVASLGVNSIDSYLSVMPWQGGQQTVLMAISGTAGRAFPNHLAWSPDGRMLAFSVADGVAGDGQGFVASAFSCEDLFAASADGKQLYRLTFSQTGHGATSPAWSPDGHQIAYLAYAGTAADDTAGWPPLKRELHVLDLLTGSDRDVAACGDCQDLAWSVDARTIAAIGGDYEGLILIDVAGGIATRALVDAGVTAFRWAADGTSLLAIGTNPPVAYPVDLTRSGVGGGPLIGPERVIVPTGTWVFSPGDVVLDGSGHHMLGMVERHDTGLPTVLDVDVSLARPITVPVLPLEDSHSVSYVWSPDDSMALVQTARQATVFTIALSNPIHGSDLSTYAIRGPGRLAWQPTWP
jgi:WD40-like Beta Propeller Repeat